MHLNDTMALYIDVTGEPSGTKNINLLTGITGTTFQGYLLTNIT